MMESKFLRLFFIFLSSDDIAIDNYTNDVGEDYVNGSGEPYYKVIGA